MEYTQLPPITPKIELKSTKEDKLLKNTPTLNTAEKKKLTLSNLDMLISRISTIQADDEAKFTRIKDLLKGYEGQLDDMSGLTKTDLLNKLIETKENLYGSVVFHLPQTIYENSLSTINNRVKPFLADVPLQLANQLFPEADSKYSAYEGGPEKLLQKENIKILASKTDYDYTTPKYTPPENSSKQYKENTELTNQKWENYNKDQFMTFLKAKWLVKEQVDGTLLINYPLLDAEIRDRTLGVAFIKMMKQFGLFELAREKYRGGNEAEIMAKLSAYANNNPTDKHDKTREAILPGTIIESTKANDEYLMTVEFLKRNTLNANNSLRYQLPYQELNSLAKEVGLDFVETVYSLKEGRAWADNSGWKLKGNVLQAEITFNPSLPQQNLQHLFSNENRENLARGNQIVKEFKAKLAENPQIKLRSDEWRNLLLQTIDGVDNNNSNLIMFEELQTFTFVQDYIDFHTTINKNNDFQKNTDETFRSVFFTEADEIKWAEGTIKNFSDLSGEAQEALLYTTTQGPEYVKKLNAGLAEYFDKLNTADSGFARNYKNGSNIQHFPEKTEELLNLMNKMTRENGIGATIKLNPEYFPGSNASPIIAVLSEPKDIHPAYTDLNNRYTMMQILKQQSNIINNIIK
jgi:hypothetical protein